jgi:hypothetical protein
MTADHEDPEARGFQPIGSLIPMIGPSLPVSDSTPTTPQRSSATTGGQKLALVASTGAPSGARTVGANPSGNDRDWGGHRPTKPSLTPRVRSLLAISVRMLFPEGSGPITILDAEWQPPLADAELLADARVAIGRLEDYLAPINPVRLSLRISVLLTQYWTPELGEAESELLLEMWVNQLQWFPEWAVIEAIGQWFGNCKGKPECVDLVRLCRELTGDASAELHNLRRVVDPWEQEQARLRLKATEAERQRAAEREAFLAANPDWTLGLPDTGPRLRPLEPEPFDKERHRQALEQLKHFRLPDPDDPRVVERMRRWEEEAIDGQSRVGATNDEHH